MAHTEGEVVCLRQREDGRDKLVTGETPSLLMRPALQAVRETASVSWALAWRDRLLHRVHSLVLLQLFPLSECTCSVR